MLTYGADIIMASGACIDDDQQYVAHAVFEEPPSTISCVVKAPSTLGTNAPPPWRPPPMNTPSPP